MKILPPLYVQVLLGVALGVLLGHLWPAVGSSLKPLSFLFVNAIKMLITPIIFLSLVSGITRAGNLSSIGKIGGTALCYFIVMTAIALVIGLAVANVLTPGAGLTLRTTDFDLSEVQQYTGTSSQALSLSHFVLHLIPTTFISAFVDGDILQVLIVAFLFSIALLQLGHKADSIIEGINLLTEVFFKIIALVVRFAPLGAFAAMAFTIGQYGIQSLLPLLFLLLCFYLTCTLFILLGLGVLLRWYSGISIFRLIYYVKDELFIVLGTSSSESVLPNLMTKLENLGCDRSVVSLVLPLGYSFNLDGTCIYLTLAALFIAQALHIDLTVWQQLSLLGVMLITSKGAAGITGSGFIILAASLSLIGHIPAESIVLILGVDRFMSEGRALTNMLGNCIATLVIAQRQQKLQATPALDLLRGVSVNYK